MISAWIVACHVVELKRHGDFVSLPGMDLAVMNVDDEIVAFDNKCPHRGARIYPPGTQGNRRPVCGYHGRCAQISDIARMKVVVVDGWVCVATMEDANIVGVVQALAHLPRREVVGLVGMISWPIACHWTTAVENALDHEHVEAIHRDSLARMSITPRQFEPLADGSSAQVFDSTSPTVRARLARMRALTGQQSSPDYIHVHAAPFSCVSTSAALGYSLQQYIPNGEGTHFSHRLYATHAGIGVDSMFEQMLAFNERVFREDTVLCETIPMPPQREILGRSDARISHFRTACSAII